MSDRSPVGSVLLVDDEKELVETVSERLLTRGIDAKVVYSGEEALFEIERGYLDVVVLDLKMPGVDGLEVLRRLRVQRSDVEVIVLTGHGSDTDEAAARDFGVFAYLTKPQKIDTLAATIRRAHSKRCARLDVSSCG